VTRAVVPGMVARGRGHVGESGIYGAGLAYPGRGGVLRTKAAVKLINDGLRQDLMGTPVRVSDIGAGWWRRSSAKCVFAEIRSGRRRCIRTSRPLTPDDVADAIVWATTRPAHVDVAHLIVTTIDQAEFDYVQSQGIGYRDQGLGKMRTEVRRGRSSTVTHRRSSCFTASRGSSACS